MERLKGYTTLPFHSTLRVLHLQVESALEYVNGSVLLIFSVPILIQNRHLVVEIVKDITRSMTVDLKDQKFKDELPSIIGQLNAISTLDALTGLRNRSKDNIIDRQTTPWRNPTIAQ